ncbi:hypothetical protein M231_03234 [Tremella mesenterica]|uniref:Uncharacterized protein n=1 Tax=Tremella mesenterica TaxID=5217 RepID=A0A4Q1BNU8_TREME|nr:hypothetical protein M231_03234 [Tremella mesenterica]
MAQPQSTVPAFNPAIHKVFFCPEAKNVQVLHQILQTRYGPCPPVMTHVSPGHQHMILVLRGAIWTEEQWASITVSLLEAMYPGTRFIDGTPEFTSILTLSQPSKPRN